MAAVTLGKVKTALEEAVFFVLLIAQSRETLRSGGEFPYENLKMDINGWPYWTNMSGTYSRIGQILNFMTQRIAFLDNKFSYL
ncbi:hypothetical protein [Chryseobacterium sp. RR2-3-20]|uniref:hypothetical protein n=1 Tax=Chryseobacterium sp. RR2-3-20 TaxID=2787626 RepID=UPI001AE0D1DD|nr:hypothetical protein [Chryseobacterium sp. RR2-3-20]